MRILDASVVETASIFTLALVGIVAQSRLTFKIPMNHSANEYIQRNCQSFSLHFGIDYAAKGLDKCSPYGSTDPRPGRIMCVASSRSSFTQHSRPQPRESIGAFGISSERSYNSTKDRVPFGGGIVGQCLLASIMGASVERVKVNSNCDSHDFSVIH